MQHYQDSSPSDEYLNPPQPTDSTSTPLTQTSLVTSSPLSQIHVPPTPSHDHIQIESDNFEQKVAHSSVDSPSPPPQTTLPRLFFDLFAGHSAPLSAAAKTANIDHFYPFDIEFNHVCDILNDDQFETLLKLAHSGLIGAIWSAPPCRLYSSLRKNDGGPPPLRSKDFLNGLPSLSPSQLTEVAESREIHRRSDILCIAVFQQGGFAAKEQPLNSLAWKEPSHQQFASQCSCHLVATPACKWGLDIFKTWAIAATSDRISTLAGRCTHSDHMDFRGKRLPDGSFVSSITAEYPSALASAIIETLRPWTSQSSIFNFDIAQWRNLLAKKPITRGPRITDGAGDSSSANWTIPFSNDHFQTLRQRWIKRILQSKFHYRFVAASKTHSAEPFITEEELAPFLQDIRDSFPSVSFDVSILPHQPFRLHLLHSLLLLAEDPDSNIALLLQQGIASGAFSQIEPAGIWAPNTKPLADFPDLQICEENWSSANQDPSITAMLIQNEINNGFIEEIPDLRSAEARWPLGIALGKLGVVHADNRDPRLVLDSTICGMNGRCFIPEKQRLPNIRHISWFLSSCPPLQDEWQGASIDIKAAHKRMLIREDERGSLLFRFQGRLFAYRSAHFGAKTSAWHWGRVSAALLRLLHRVLYFRHAAWVYVDDFFFLFPGGTASLQFTLSIILLQVIGAPLSWKKLEYDSSIEWNGWSIQPALMTAQLPQFKHEKTSALIDPLLQNPCRKNLEKIIGILLWATSLVHHVRFLLTSLYRDLYSIPATNYSIPPTQWEYFLRLLNDSATIAVKNSLHLPLEAKVVEFRHSTITAKDQLPIDLPIDRHVWVRIRDPNCDKRKLSSLSPRIHYSGLKNHFCPCYPPSRSIELPV